MPVEIPTYVIVNRMTGDVILRHHDKVLTKEIAHDFATVMNANSRTPKFTVCKLQPE